MIISQRNKLFAKKHYYFNFSYVWPWVSLTMSKISRIPNRIFRNERQKKTKKKRRNQYSATKSLNNYNLLTCCIFLYNLNKRTWATCELVISLIQRTLSNIKKKELFTKIVNDFKSRLNKRTWTKCELLIKEVTTECLIYKCVIQNPVKHIR